MGPKIGLYYVKIANQEKRKVFAKKIIKDKKAKLRNFRISRKNVYKIYGKGV